jgi:hypothetical protein
VGTPRRQRAAYPADGLTCRSALRSGFGGVFYEYDCRAQTSVRFARGLPGKRATLAGEARVRRRDRACDDGWDEYAQPNHWKRCYCIQQFPAKRSLRRLYLRHQNPHPQPPRRSFLLPRRIGCVRTYPPEPAIFRTGRFYWLKCYRSRRVASMTAKTGKPISPFLRCITICCSNKIQPTRLSFAATKRVFAGNLCVDWTRSWNYRH